MKYNKINTLLENHAENEALFLKKASYELKPSDQVVCSLVSIYFDSSQLGIQLKNNYIKLYTIDFFSMFLIIHIYNNNKILSIIIVIETPP